MTKLTIPHALYVLLFGVSLCAAQAAVAAEPAGVELIEQQVTHYRPVQQHKIVPVRTYRPEVRVEGWWNPFRAPTYRTHYVPQTRWEERWQTNYVPVPRKIYVARLSADAAAGQPLVLANRPSITTQRVQPRLTDRLPLVPVVGASARAVALTRRKRDYGAESENLSGAREGPEVSRL